jgi:hypothetical protein
MRLESSGKYEYRKDLADDVAKRFGENARSKAFDAGMEFALRVTENLKRASEHPDMTPELAELLSTGQVQLEVRRETEFSIE